MRAAVVNVIVATVVAVVVVVCEWLCIHLQKGQQVIVGEFIEKNLHDKWNLLSDKYFAEHHRIALR